MEPALVTAAFGAGCATVGSLVTGLVLKASERRRALQDAGPLEVHRMQSIDRYDSLRALETSMAELDHCVAHLAAPRTRKEVDRYLGRGEQFRLRAREIARAERTFFGEELYKSVIDATDTLQRFLALVAEKRTDQDVLSMEIIRDLRHDWRHKENHVRFGMQRARHHLRDGSS